MSLKHFFKRHLPHQEHIRKQGIMRLLSDYLHDPNIWRLHRRSSAGGAAIGIFCAFIPLPVQTLGSATLAILCRVNLPLALAFSLISNPVTIPPIFYSAYKLGATLLGLGQRQIEFSLSAEWISTTLAQIWQPLLLGCLILGTGAALMTYLLIRLIWRISAVSKWENRRRMK